MLGKSVDKHFASLPIWFYKYPAKVFGMSHQLNYVWQLIQEHQTFLGYLRKNDAVTIAVDIQYEAKRAFLLISAWTPTASDDMLLAPSYPWPRILHRMLCVAQLNTEL